MSWECEDTASLLLLLAFVFIVHIIVWYMHTYMRYIRMSWRRLSEFGKQVPPHPPISEKHKNCSNISSKSMNMNWLGWVETHWTTDIPKILSATIGTLLLYYSLFTQGSPRKCMSCGVGGWRRFSMEESTVCSREFGIRMLPFTTFTSYTISQFFPLSSPGCMYILFCGSSERMASPHRLLNN